MDQETRKVCWTGARERPRKLLQQEVRLKGRAELVFSVLPKESVNTAIDSLRKWLAPINREALLSAQLIKRKQKAAETVDRYAQSYGRMSGMDQESKDLLKRDLFVLGLLQWRTQGGAQGARAPPSALTKYRILSS